MAHLARAENLGEVSRDYTAEKDIGIRHGQVPRLPVAHRSRMRPSALRPVSPEQISPRKRAIVYRMETHTGHAHERGGGARGMGRIGGGVAVGGGGWSDVWRVYLPITVRSRHARPHETRLDGATCSNPSKRREGEREGWGRGLRAQESFDQIY